VEKNINNGDDSALLFSIVIDAIIKNKKPEIEISSINDDLALNAAIVLANEIVSKSPPSI